MAMTEDIKELIKSINSVSENQVTQQDNGFWEDSGAKLLLFLDKIILKSELANASMPKDSLTSNQCILTAILNVVNNIPNVNLPFRNGIWEESPNSDLPQNGYGMISFYELAFSRSCSLICQLLGDKIQNVQKILIKFIFGKSKPSSLLASDLYVFIFRIINPQRKMAMCQILMNLCKLAPPDSVVKGAALLNRIKHPVINFENSKYQHILDFS